MTTAKDDFKRDRRQMKQERKTAKEQVKNAYREMHHNFSGIGEVLSHDGKTFVDGISNFRGGEFGELFIEGICSCSEDITASKINVEGVFNCNGNLNADEFFCEGTAQIKGNIRANEIDVSGIMEIKGRLEADKIICEGVIRVEGEISADLVQARGAIVAREILGDKVVIRSEVRSFFRRFLHRYERVNFIEATVVELHRVNAKTVNGHDIYIGRKCKIDRIDCSGTLFVDPTAEVTEIVGKYERKQ